MQRNRGATVAGSQIMTVSEDIGGGAKIIQPRQARVKSPYILLFNIIYIMRRDGSSQVQMSGSSQIQMSALAPMAHSPLTVFTVWEFGHDRIPEVTK
jgi:hypothetical protein